VISLLAGKRGTHEEFQEFLAEMASLEGTLLELPEVTGEEKSDDPMWAADSSVPEDWFFIEE
jgi:hypothetical protein